MSEINLPFDIIKHAEDSKPTYFGPQKVTQPGAFAAPSNVPPIVIPPINSITDFTMIPDFKLSDHPGLAAIDITTLPEEFNWRYNQTSDTPDILKKKKLITIPGNQMLCGSCWAISGAGIIADNFVVSGVVDWQPNLSTTWSIACYPQKKCQGGNPAVLFQDVAKGGIATDSCVDYSWCANNPNCNGKATQHFKGAPSVDLSSLIPKCGCYDNTEHYLFTIDENIKTLFVGATSIKTSEELQITAKKHIFTKGPLMGAFLVFKNFMQGTFTHMNGGVYLENGVYTTNGKVTFDAKQTDVSNYVGAHAIAIIGWGIEKGINTIDGVKDVPYWYCRNSWTTKWGDGGYFKFAMYPFNKVSVFETRVTLNTPKGAVATGGMVAITASKKPILKKIESNGAPTDKLLEPSDYYTKEVMSKGIDPGYNNNEGPAIHWDKVKKLLGIIGIVIIILLIIYGVYYFVTHIKRTKRIYTNIKGISNKPSYKPTQTKSVVAPKGRAGSYGFGFM